MFYYSKFYEIKESYLCLKRFGFIVVSQMKEEIFNDFENSKLFKFFQKLPKIL